MIAAREKYHTKALAVDLNHGFSPSVIGDLNISASRFVYLRSPILSGWGVDGITTFQRGFPLKITWAGPSTPLENANFGVGAIRPDVVAGCNKGGSRTVLSWFNTACFAAPLAWGFGDESRVDASLRADGINNFDCAFFKRTGITERTSLEFRTEFFNLFKREQFGIPGTGFISGNSNGFGTVTSSNPDSNPHLIEFALKFIF